MKLRNFFLSILAGAALAAGCAQEQVISSIPEFKVEKSYLGLPLEGGIATAPVTATASWSRLRGRREPRLLRTDGEPPGERGRQAAAFHRDPGRTGRL